MMPPKDLSVPASSNVYDKGKYGIKDPDYGA